MATFIDTHTQDDSEVRCDDCSSFGPDGFASDDRSWTPIYGVDCSLCGEPA